MDVNVRDSATDAAAIIGAMEERLELKVLKGNVDGKDVQYLAMPEGYSLKSVKGMLDEYLPRPDRIKGKSSHQTLESFVAHVNAFHNASTVIFGNVRDLTLTAVYNYETGKGDDDAGALAGFRDHRAVYNILKSDEWNCWMKNNGNEMNQKDFALMIEDNILDVIEPPKAKDASKTDRALLELATTLNTKYAEPVKLLELSRGIQINENNKASSAYDPATGCYNISYETKHENKRGDTLVVPGFFMIAIPIFLNGDRYRIPVRLQYRVREGAVKWIYKLCQPEKFVKDAFDEVCIKTKTETATTVYRGSVDG